ncbi:MAG: patatin-like phospholipase family protein, partial [Gammaproteobacteria bacterium]
LYAADPNIKHLKETVLNGKRGDLTKPILASAACPGAFPPINIENQNFVDCGVADPVPVRLAKKLGFKTVIAVNIAEQLPTSSPNHIFGVLKRSLEIAYINQSQYAAENADLVINFHFKDIGTFTDQYNNYLYQQGKKSAKKAIPKILEILKNK